MMEATQTADGQLLITGAGGDQPLIMSAEDAAQFLAQAGLQLADIGDSERIIIGQAGQDQHELMDGNGVVTAESLLAAGMDVGSEVSGEINDGTVLYIDPNDPQAAALLQQAGLTLAEDGTVQSIEDVAAKMAGYENGNSAQDYFMAANQQQQQHNVKKETISSIVPDVKEQDYGDANDFMDTSGIVDRTSNALEEASTLAALATAHPDTSMSSNSPAMPVTSTPARGAQTTTVPASAIQVGPDQQQVFYSVTGEDGKTQQYMMLCPKDMDQNTLIQTLVRQISSDPTSRGKKTIRITQQKKSVPPVSKPPRVTAAPKVTAVQRGRKPVVTSLPMAAAPRQQQQQQLQQHQQQQQQMLQASHSEDITRKMGEILEANSSVLDGSTNFETMEHQQQQFMNPSDNSMLDMSAILPSGNETRVYVRCNYCATFRSTLNGDTWEGILNHILPVCKEELQTTFYGDLGKHFIRSVRIQVNGKQIMRTESPTGGEVNTPQCEVILTHSLVCRKTKREFIINQPDATFIANLAKHIRMTQPGQGGRGNSLLCIFCNSPFTYEDYLRHIQPHIEAILATLSCFAGAYCTTSYDSLRTTSNCMSCQEPEAADLRFLPCTKFSTEYHCLAKLQFGIECFRENYGDGSGFMRLSTNHMAKCTVCKNPQQVYCAVFHITSTVLGGADDASGQQNVDSQLCVCVNCQKQFINIVMKEKNFDDRMKIYQLRNMEQLCSCLRVILGQVKAICQDKKTLIYTVHENTSNANSTVHTVKGAEVSELTPVTKLMAMAENEIAASPVKAFFVCDLCMFTVDLTSLIATPANRQKNEMLLSIVLEHVVPHTDSLMNVIASAASNRTFNLKFEVSSNVTEQQNTGQRKIVLSLRKKFHSQFGTAAEVVIDKDDEITINAIRSAVKSERKSYVSVRGARGGPSDGPETPPTITTTTSASTSQQVEINKFIDKQKSKFGIWAQCGCNTTLLNSYMECRLCSKFCFPDFRLGATAIEMCENCVETVLTLCLPSEPETLEVSEECLALKEFRNVGHRLVLATDLKKWLSLDGVHKIKKTVEEFDRAKANECSTVFSDGIRQHLLAALKTCQNDEDITTAVAGFCITDDFLTPANTGMVGADSETAAALASLQEQVGMPIRQAEERRPVKERQIEVKILSRRPPNSTKKTPIPIRFGSKFGANFKRVIKNGTVIDLGSPSTSADSPASSGTTATNQAKVIYLNSAAAKKAEEESSQEESVSAIQSFLEETSPEKSTTTIIDGKEVRVPAGIKITSAGKGVVNIRAITDSRPSPVVKATGRVPMTVTPSKTTTPNVTAKKPIAAPSVGSVRGIKGVSMVTLTAGGIIKKVSDAKKPMTSLSDEDDPDDEGDSDDDMFDDEDMEHNNKVAKATPTSAPRKAGRVGRPPKQLQQHGDPDDDDYKPPSGVLKGKQPKKIPILKQSAASNATVAPTDSPVAAAPTAAAPTALDESNKDNSVVDVLSNSTLEDSTASNSEEPRTKRARKEKKIFDL